MVEQKQLEQQIQSYVEGYISEDSSLFIVEISLKGSFGNQRLLISLDGDSGVSIDKCVSVSRRLSAVLEENDLIEGKYHLEVSSAGIDQPLRFLRQYKKNVGRSLRVALKDGQTVEGELTEVNEKGIMLLISEKKKTSSLNIDFEEIESSKVLVSFK